VPVSEEVLVGGATGYYANDEAGAATERALRDMFTDDPHVRDAESLTISDEDANLERDVLLSMQGLEQAISVLARTAQQAADAAEARGSRIDDALRRIDEAIERLTTA